jgi:hypothetical protein
VLEDQLVAAGEHGLVSREDELPGAGRLQRDTNLRNAPLVESGDARVPEHPPDDRSALEDDQFLRCEVVEANLQYPGQRRRDSAQHQPVAVDRPAAVGPIGPNDWLLDEHLQQLLDEERLPSQRPTISSTRSSGTTSALEEPPHQLLGGLRRSDSTSIHRHQRPVEPLRVPISQVAG